MIIGDNWADDYFTVFQNAMFEAACQTIITSFVFFVNLFKEEPEIYGILPCQVQEEWAVFAAGMWRTISNQPKLVSLCNSTECKKLFMYL